MHIFSSLDYSFLVNELARSLNGKHFNRMRKLGESIYRLKIGTSEIICELGIRIHFTKYIEPTEDDKFTEKLNKELDNAKLLSIEQINNDRIVAFQFDKGSLIFEMFGKGNAVLVRDGKTICASTYESWSDREIKPGSPYQPPKTAPSKNLEVSDKYIIVSLMRLPLGKEYALEALARCGIDEKTPGNSLSGNKILALEQEIKHIREQAKPYAFYEKEKMVDFSLAKLRKYQNTQSFETRGFASLSEVADEYYAHLEKSNPKLEKLLDRLEKQKERMHILLEEEKTYREKGDLIYADYQKIEEILVMAKAGKFDELEKKGAKIDKKEKSVELEI